jgi:hypothetical protein
VVSGIAAPAERAYEFLLDQVSIWTAPSGAGVDDVSGTPEVVGTTPRTVFPMPPLSRLGAKWSVRLEHHW